MPGPATAGYAASHSLCSSACLIGPFTWGILTREPSVQPHVTRHYRYSASSSSTNCNVPFPISATTSFPMIPSCPPRASYM